MQGHGHTHDHSHAHGGGAHAHVHDHRALTGDPRNRRALVVAMVLALVFLVVEVIGGVVYNSLALLSDAAHMVTDVAAYALALFAWWIAQRPATARRTYGFARAEILAALANGATLIAASGWIVVEAVQRLVRPEPVGGTGVMVVAAAGLVANIFIVLALLRADREHLNIRAALAHGVTDALSSVAVLVSGAIVAFWGINRADSVTSLLVAALVLWGSWRLVRESVDVLLDAAPSGIDGSAVAGAMLECDAVNEVHDLHVWTMAPGTPALSAHVRAAPGVAADTVLAELETVLAARFRIHHTTLQVTTDREGSPLETVDMLPVEDAVEWATEHLASSNPQLSRSVIAAATGAAALDVRPGSRVSPISISLRALEMLRGGRRTDTTPDD